MKSLLPASMVRRGAIYTGRTLTLVCLGSGKHCNWSLSTNTGRNLLDPGEEPAKNAVFLVFLVATLRAVQKHAGLLRAAIASASNDHRLGANEAPPAIVSVFLGQYLDEVLNAVEDQRELSCDVLPRLQNMSLGATTLDVKVSVLPEIARDKTDRNRTSPFAFTGNKFEFRAVGSHQSPSFPVTLLNAAMGAALQEIAADIKAEASRAGEFLNVVNSATLSVNSAAAPPNDPVVFSVIRRYIKLTKPVRFEGNNYASEWTLEAAARGLLNLKASPEAYEQLFASGNMSMLLDGAAVYSKSELELRYFVLMEKYAKDLLIEARTLVDLLNQFILPAAFSYRAQLADSIKALSDIQQVADSELQMVTLIGNAAAALTLSLKQLSDVIRVVDDLLHVEPVKAAYEAKKLLDLMLQLRQHADLLEEYIPDSIYPIPKYYDILF